MEQPPAFKSQAEEIEYWKKKAQEYRSLQEDTQQQFEEFQADSRDLEKELEQQLGESEKKLKESTSRLDKVSNELADIKDKFSKSKDQARGEISSLESKIQQYADSDRKLRARIRELEQTNDDFERFERVTTTSLTEAEQKYNSVVERTILLEQEIEEKQKMQEELQRLRDEIRDLNLELQIMRSKHPEDRMKVDSEPDKPRSASIDELRSERVDAPKSANSSSGAIVQEMISRVKTLEKRLASCRSIVKPLLTNLHE